jgi:hypothetical protein
MKIETFVFDFASHIGICSFVIINCWYFYAVHIFIREGWVETLQIVPWRDYAGSLEGVGIGILFFSFNVEKL